MNKNQNNIFPYTVYSKKQNRHIHHQNILTREAIYSETTP